MTEISYYLLGELAKAGQNSSPTVAKPDMKTLHIRSCLAFWQGTGSWQLWLKMEHFTADP